MATADGSDWPLPSQDTRVRRLFYLAEGMSIGAGVSAILLYISMAVFPFLIAGSYTEVTIGGVFLFIIALILIARNDLIAFSLISAPESDDPPPEYQDWQETRQWKWIAVVAIIISLILFTASVFIWGWVLGGLLYGPGVMVVALISGLGLWGYFNHKIGAI